ncbi:MAG: sulfur carrier protein ThiS [Thermodesulfobacteriota bacterium]
MRIVINSQNQDFKPGIKLSQVFNIIKENKKDDPVIKFLKDKTGFDHITLMLNGQIVSPEEYDSIELKEGDEIYWVVPHAGG